jgi:hypothetical protein
MPQKAFLLCIFLVSLQVAACNTTDGGLSSQDGVSADGQTTSGSDATTSGTSGSDATTSGTSGTSGSDATTSGTSGTSGSDATTSGADAPDEDTTPPLPETTPLLDRIVVSEVTVEEGVMAGVSSWRVWGRGSLNVAPVFSEPLASCETLVCFTTEGGGEHTARIARLDSADQLQASFVLGAGLECRGLAVEPDGHFAALLWDDASDRIYVRRYDAQGQQTWETELINADNKPDDFGIGDGRLAYGDGKYGAYYHVHSDSGHEGDTLKWVDAASGVESTGWGWGCSHSMSALLSYHPDANKFMPACVTDCFPGTSGDFSTQSKGGIYLNHNKHVMDVNAGCNGSVAGELGGAALSPTGWALTFNAHQAPVTLGQTSYDKDTMNQDIGLATVNADYSVVGISWLTDTAGVNEADSAITRWLPSGDAEQYVVGWSEPGTPYTYRLGRVSAQGAWLEGPVDVSAVAQWGRRDDPFRAHTNDDIIWSWFDAPGSATLRFARVRSGNTATCNGF